MGYIVGVGQLRAVGSSTQAVTVFRGKLQQKPIFSEMSDGHMFHDQIIGLANVVFTKYGPCLVGAQYCYGTML